jgi:hypothetical protein
MLGHFMSKDRTIRRIGARLLRAGDRPRWLRGRGPGGAPVGSTLVSIQQ